MRLSQLTTLLICALGFSLTAARAQEKLKPQRIVKEGVEIEFTIDAPDSRSKPTTPMAGQDTVFRFRIRDTATKTPLSGIRPAAWIAQRERPGAPAPAQCRAKVESYLQGSMRSRPDVDLNSYFVLALNEEPTISVIDPLVGFGGSKLFTMIRLESPGDDWALMSNRSKLFVSMPLFNQVAVVDTTTWKVISNVATGVKPKRVLLQPDERYLWVADEKGVTVIDTTTLKVAKQIATGTGHHEIAFASDNKFAFVTNRDDGTLSIINVAKLAKLKDVKTGALASSISFSPLSKALYVTNDVDGSISVVDAASHKLLANIAAKPGIMSVRFAPGGRWGFAPNPKQSIVYIFDASTNRMVHEYSIADRPDQVAFSDQFAYVRSLGSELVSVIRLATVGGELDVVKFPGGQNAPGTSTNFVASADAFVAAPEPGAMLIANPADKMIYYYSEGMAAPMGNFQNYRRIPRALKVVDRSLREELLGVYSTTARLPKQGVYNVALVVDSPRIVHCFEAVAAENPLLPPDKKTSLRIEYLNKDTSFTPGENAKIRFRLLDTKTKKPNSSLKDVGVLVFLPPGSWQTRQIARSLGDGTYEVSVNLPEAGVYLVFVESPSQRVVYRELPYLMLHAKASSTHHHHPQHRHASPPADRAPSVMSIPDVEVLDQDGRKVHFYTDLVKGKTVAINFIFTSCTTICPPLGATFARVQKELAARPDIKAHFISVSVDPVTDTPERLKAWRAKFTNGTEWTLVTGDKTKMDQLLRALAAATATPSDHSPTIIIGNDALGQWTRTYGLAKPSQIIQLIDQASNGSLESEAKKR